MHCSWHWWISLSHRIAIACEYNIGHWHCLAIFIVEPALHYHTQPYFATLAMMLLRLMLMILLMSLFTSYVFHYAAIIFWCFAIDIYAISFFFFSFFAIIFVCSIISYWYAIIFHYYYFHAFSCPLSCFRLLPRWWLRFDTLMIFCLLRHYAIFLSFAIIISPFFAVISSLRYFLRFRHFLLLLFIATPLLMTLRFAFLRHLFSPFFAFHWYFLRHWCHYLIILLIIIFSLIIFHLIFS